MESQQRCIHTLPHRASSLTFSPDGKTLVSFSNNNKTTNVWDVNTGELKKSFTGLVSIALSLDGKTLAGSNNDNSIKLWDVETGELKNSLTGNSYLVSYIALSSDGKTLLSRDGSTIKLWNINNGELKSTIAEGFDKCSGSIFSPNGQTVAISIGGRREDGSLYNQINLWDVESCQLIRSLDNDCVSIAFSHDGKTLFISFDKQETSYVHYPDGGMDDYQSRYNYTKFWNLTTGEISKTFGSNHFCALSPDGQIFVGVQSEYYSSQSHRSINIIDVGKGQKIKTFFGTAAGLSPDGKILAVVSSGGEALKLFDWSREISIATIPGRISNFTFSPDGNMLAVADGETIKLWQESTEPIVTQQLHGDAYPHLKQLENLLAAELWEDADRETADIIQRFPSQDLNIIDELWVRYSNQRYGFSVQKQIWESIVQDRVRRMTMNASDLSNVEQFEFNVGWATVESRPHYHGANDEYFARAWNRTTKGYYPRDFYQGKQLRDVLTQLGEVGSDR